MLLVTEMNKRSFVQRFRALRLDNLTRNRKAFQETRFLLDIFFAMKFKSKLKKVNRFKSLKITRLNIIRLRSPRWVDQPPTSQKNKMAVSKINFFAVLCLKARIRWKVSIRNLQIEKNIAIITPREACETNLKLFKLIVRIEFCGMFEQLREFLVNTCRWRRHWISVWREKHTSPFQLQTIANSVREP